MTLDKTSERKWCAYCYVWSGEWDYESGEMDVEPDDFQKELHPECEQTVLAYIEDPHPAPRVGRRGAAG